MFKGLIFLFLFSHDALAVTVSLWSPLCPTVAARHWDRLCGGNPTNQVRGTDIYGSGAYGAPRDNDRHLGVDVICKEGSVIYAPFSGRLIRRANPYNNGNAIDNGVMMRGPGSCVKMYNFQPDRYTGRISKGRRLGTLLNVQAVFPEITSHVHIEMCDTSIDPTPNL